VVLTRRYCETSWLSSIVIVVVAAIFCLFVVGFVDKFLGLVMRPGVYP
jgi:energy-converting hydrogenase Eha subunit B